MTIQSDSATRNSDKTTEVHLGDNITDITVSIEYFDYGENYERTNIDKTCKFIELPTDQSCHLVLRESL